MGLPGKLPSGIKELIRVGSSSRTLFLQHKSSRFPHARDQARKAGNQNGLVRTSWSNLKYEKEMHRLWKQGHGNMEKI